MNKEKIFEKNLESLKKYNSKLYEKVKDISLDKKYSIEDTKLNSLFTIKVDNAYLNSKYNPIKESENIINRFIEDTYDIIFLGGFGAGYLPLQIIKKENIVIVIEKDIQIFVAALYCTDLTELFSNKKFFIIFEENNDIPELNDILLNNITKKTYTLIHPASAKVYPDFYKNLKNLIDSYLARKNINIATLSRFQNLWIKNIFKNKNLFIRHNGINVLKDKFNNLPAVVVSAGPSLSDNINLLKKNQSRFIVITVDSAFPVLIKNNIKPDFIVTVDPQFINYKYFEYNKYFDSILIAEPSAFPLILKEYRGRILFFSSVFPYVKWLENESYKKGDIDMGGSVSTTAFDFAYRLNMNPIIMIGQDLAFIKNKTHTKGSYVEKYWALRYSRYNTSLNGAYAYIHNNLFIKIKSNNNSMVETDKRLMIFLVWFKNKLKKISNKKIYNTSLNGAYIDNTVVSSFDKILAENDFSELNKKFNIQDKLDDSYFKNILEKLRYKEKNIILKDLKNLKKKVLNAVKLSNRLYDLIKKNQYATDEINSILQKLDTIDKYINNTSEVTDFLGTVIQDVIYTILEEYENELTESERNNKDLKIAKRSILLYKGILKSILLYEKLFKFYPAAASEGTEEYFVNFMDSRSRLE